jgi:DNA-binding Xre family transcriptional regulator
MCFDSLFAILDNRNIKIKDLIASRVLTSPTVTKLRLGKNIHTDVLIRLCDYLNCSLTDIVQYTPSRDSVINWDIIANETPVQHASVPKSVNPEPLKDDVTSTDSVSSNNNYIKSISGFYYDKSKVEENRIHYPSMFVSNEKYPSICPESGYAFRVNQLGSFIREED